MGHLTNTVPLGSIYTKRQRQCCDNAAMMLAILFSLKTMESLQNGVATHFQATPLFSMRIEWPNNRLAPPSPLSWCPPWEILYPQLQPTHVISTSYPPLRVIYFEREQRRFFFQHKRPSLFCVYFSTMWLPGSATIKWHVYVSLVTVSLVTVVCVSAVDGD